MIVRPSDQEMNDERPRARRHFPPSRRSRPERKSRNGNRRKRPPRLRKSSPGRITRKPSQAADELCYLQDWVRETGARVIIVLEGRDTAGKGGLIKRMTERVSPRTFRVVALSAPSERDRTKLYLQRYIEHFPAGGEVVIFDRSWYNRAGCRARDGLYQREGRRTLSRKRAQVRTLARRLRHHPDQAVARGREGGAGAPLPATDRRSAAGSGSSARWTSSPIRAGTTIRAPGTRCSRRRAITLAPWYVLRSDDKKRARLNGIKHILSQIPYEKIKRDKVELPQALGQEAATRTS